MEAISGALQGQQLPILCIKGSSVPGTLEQRDALGVDDPLKLCRLQREEGSSPCLIGCYSVA